jgi:hypothetical protein
MKNAVYWDMAPCRYRVPPKRRFTQDLHGATSQEMEFFIVTDVKTSNLGILCCSYLSSFSLLTHVILQVK